MSIPYWLPPDLSKVCLINFVILVGRTSLTGGFPREFGWDIIPCSPLIFI